MLCLLVPLVEEQTFRSIKGAEKRRSRRRRRTRKWRTATNANKLFNYSFNTAHPPPETHTHAPETANNRLPFVNEADSFAAASSLLSRLGVISPIVAASRRRQILAERDLQIKFIGGASGGSEETAASSDGKHLLLPLMLSRNTEV